MQTLQKPHDVESSSCGGGHHHLQSDDEEQQQQEQRRSSSESGCSSEIVKERTSRSSISEMDLECGVVENKVHLGKDEKDCRICHLSLDVGNQDSGLPIELGCACKEDLAAAHKHCAEAWFKIKGNKTCEICGSVAKNVVGPNEGELVEQWNEANEAASVVTAAPSMHITENRHFWQGHRFLNFLLASLLPISIQSILKNEVDSPKCCLY
ncbi:RING/FYVE/PHD zinc finger superfamily protein [Euphorbia peplus]|nr:RING/FYVE/PHD zinc finger superfamily protein [Euphorbia peplus]